jgi:UrcA family protein
MSYETIKKNLRIALAITATVAAGAPLIGHASDLDAIDVHVKYSAADLATPATTRAFYQRLNVAAHTACGTSIYEDSFARGPQKCVEKALARAIADVNNDQLAQFYVKSYGPKLAAKYEINDSVRTASN